MAALLVLVASLPIVSSCGGAEVPGGWQEDFTIPPELRGRWVTEDERYIDRMLELQSDAVIFYTGGAFGLSAHRIRQGRREETGQGTLYEIRYRAGSPDELYNFSFYYRPANGGEIRFENQPRMVWRMVDRAQP